MSDMDEIVKEFLVESKENLDQLDRDLILLEKDPSATEILASIFRTIHTIKGTSGFLALGKLEAVTHAGEHLLSRMRDGQLLLNPEITSTLLAMVDGVRAILANIESSGKEGEGEYSDLIQQITRLQEAEPQKTTRQPKANHVAAPAPRSRVATSAEENENLIGHLLVEMAGVEPAAVEAALQTQQRGDTRKIGEILVDEGTVSPSAAREVIEYQKEVRAQRLADSSIRVDVALLDKLMNLVGELVLARNQIVQFSSREHDPTFLNASQRLNLITTELQGGVMKTRMQPIGNVWSRLPRVVRDLALACGKHIRVEMEGKETELDKTLIEAIKDPLTHIVRNAVDHGIETPEQRCAAGKPSEGCIFLRAFHEGGQVNIEISDDGAGINLERVKQKALARGLITADQAVRMTDRELTNVVFLPGFSTAEKVTNVSGRGVGMDVVKTNIEKIGGTVDLQTKPGQGTTLKIKIPLTLAIVPALIVSCGGSRYAIPQVSLLELVRLEGDEAHRRIETIHGVPVYRLRGNLLPLLYLQNELAATKLHDEVTEPGGTTDRVSQERIAMAAAAKVVNIVVLQADSRQFGLVVDDISDTEEIVVKPLSKQLKRISCFAGATIMGDGRVALILDVLGLAQRACVISEVRDRTPLEQSIASKQSVEESQTLLLLQGPDDGRMAIPLSLVARLEEFKRSEIEHAEGQEVVQYRSRILPLIRLSSAVPERRQQPRNIPQPAMENENLQVVVYTADGRSMGLVVDKILDIVQANVSLRSQVVRQGTLGSIVVQGRVAELLDMTNVMETAGMAVLAQSAGA